MSQSVFVMETPKDCLHCKMRSVIYGTGSDRGYQHCHFDTNGYRLESFFKGEELKDGWISPKCPLVSKADIRASVIDEFAKALKRKYHIAECGFGLINDKLHENIDEIAEQLKERE